MQNPPTPLLPYNQKPKLVNASCNFKTMHKLLHSTELASEKPVTYYENAM